MLYYKHGKGEVGGGWVFSPGRWPQADTDTAQAKFGADAAAER